MSYPTGTTTTGAPVVAVLPVVAVAPTAATYTTGTPGLVTAAPGASGLPHTHSSTTSTTSHIVPGTTTTTVVDDHHHGRRGSHDESHLTKDQKKLEKEHLKQEKAAAKEHEKHEKQLHKEQVKHEKEVHKQEVKAEKEHLKEEKRLEKERRHQWEAARKTRHDRYTAEEKTLGARLRSDVAAWDTTHGQTAPIGYYNEQHPDTLAWEGLENIGLFVAVPRARGLVEAKEKVDAYCKVVLVSHGADGKEHVHSTHKSSTIKDNANPEWWFTMDDVPHLLGEDHHWQQSGKLRIEVWDHDTFSRDDLLGSVEWPLQALDGKVTRGNFQLVHNPNLVANKKSRVHPTQQGSIWVEIRYRSPFAYNGMHTGVAAPAGYGYTSGHLPLSEAERKHQLDAMHHQHGAVPLAGSTTYAHVPGTTTGVTGVSTGYPTGGAIAPALLGAGAVGTALPVHASHAPIYTTAPGAVTGAYIDNDPAHYRHPHHTGAIPGEVYKEGHGAHGTHGNRVQEGSIVKNIGPLASHGEPGYATGVVPAGGVMGAHHTGGAHYTGAPVVGAAPYTGVGAAPLPPASAGLAHGGAPGAVAVQVVTDAPASAAPQVAAAALAAAKAAADNVAMGGAAPAYVHQPGTGVMPGTTTTTTTHHR